MNLVTLEDRFDNPTMGSLPAPAMPQQLAQPAPMMMPAMMPQFGFSVMDQQQDYYDCSQDCGCGCGGRAGSGGQGGQDDHHNHNSNSNGHVIIIGQQNPSPGQYAPPQQYMQPPPQQYAQPTPPPQYAPAPSYGGERLVERYYPVAVEKEVPVRVPIPYPVDRTVTKFIDRPVVTPIDRVVDRYVNRDVVRPIDRPIPIPRDTNVVRPIDRQIPVVVHKDVLQPIDRKPKKTPPVWSDQPSTF